ncbi:RNHCP domain-containing protein [Deinococcus detaillensis]|uniref:RNHCP domain-containing protein n=1 Tax=Deinococcus detaillensis TaxID=2592048 RepID=A0A553UU48_9DEIO|nr:RNHCP domain-containing protein [Deinococcus detaillensis]TSA83732.1 RNHCP domain-containing protein [Deinococcus detaillensis]
MTRRFTVSGTNTAFSCAHCGLSVLPLSNGSVRNHCPACLHSLHLDVFPGDRAANCGGLLEPMEVEQHPKKGWMIAYRCQKCGHTGRNKAALDDPNQPDDFEALLAVSARQRD